MYLLTIGLEHDHYLSLDETYNLFYHWVISLPDIFEALLHENILVRMDGAVALHSEYIHITFST